MSLHPHSGGEVLLQPGSASPYRFGKYTLLAKLAQGGMGEIFVALLSGAAGFEKLVVIKRILPHLAEDPRFVAMFLAEAKLTASLAHPNICQVFELGEIEGDYYLAMEYLEGVSLSRMVKKRVHRGLDLRVAGGIACQALEGLQFAHRFRAPGGGLVGVIHRDMSPANVFLSSAGLVKVLDFGVAKVSHHHKTTVTGLKGKYPYMAPEQIRGMDVDGRSDLFSVGVVLFEAVTGEPLFHRDNDFDTLQAIVNSERPRVSDLRPDVPLDLEEVIERALRSRREERYASAREMGDAIARALAPMGGPATSAELADVLRRECASDIDEERGRIDRAADHLKELAGRGVEVPELNRRRARPVVENELDGRPRRSSTLPFDGSDTSAATSVGSAASELAERHGARRRRIWVALAGLGLAGVAGVTGGLYAAGQGEEPRPVASQPVAPPPSVEKAVPVPVSVPDPDPDPETVPDPVPDPPKKVTRQPAPKEPPAVPAGPGYFSMDSMPYSEVFIDGKSVGITPVVKVPLKPGKHTVKAVTQSGESKKLTIQIKSGQVVSKRLEIGETP